MVDPGQRISNQSTLGEKELGQGTRKAWFALEDQTQNVSDSHQEFARKIVLNGYELLR